MTYLRTNREARPSRSFIGAVGIMLVLSTWIWNAVDGANIGYVIVMAVLSSVPFVLYIAFMKTRTGILITGTTLLVATAAVYGSVFASDSSTSAFGFIVSPMLNFLILGAGGAIDSLLRRR